MNAPLSFFDAPPRSRATDPSTSREAAVSVKPGNSDLIKAIKLYVYHFNPATAFDIAQHIAREFPGRWDEGTVRSAVSRAGLRAVDTEGSSPRSTPTRKIRCIRYTVDGA